MSQPKDVEFKMGHRGLFVVRFVLLSRKFAHVGSFLIKSWPNFSVSSMSGPSYSQRGRPEQMTKHGM